MILGSAEALVNLVRAPRTSGDDPRRTDCDILEKLCSPHERG